MSLMYERRFGTAMVFIAVMVSPLVVECRLTMRPMCEVGNRNSYVEGHCNVKMTPVPDLDSGEMYSECVTVHVLMKADDFCKSPRIEILSSKKEIIRPTMMKRKNNKKCDNGIKRHEIRVKCQRLPQSNTSLAVWELVHDCVTAKAESAVSVFYSTASTSCNVSYTVQDPIPPFDLSVNWLSKSITITVEPGKKVYTRLCYISEIGCVGEKRSTQITIDPSQSKSAILDIPYLLPCVCVQVYYTYTDSRRHRKCPFQNQSLADVGDIWLSSEVELYETSLKWKSKCPVGNMNISASLCWRQREHLCTASPNSTLEEKQSGQHLNYGTSAVDKHPQMCVQFSLQGSHHISCPFQADMSSWEVYIGAGRQSVFLYLTSSIPATFSAQLCVLNERTCTPIGEIHSVTMNGSTTDTRINVPVYSLAEKPCVQVWRIDPSLQGRRILCPDYAHKRYASLAVAALTLVVIATLLGTFIHHLIKNGAAGWLCIQKPVLLVCSSEQSAHISAVCALASILQGELSATVHLSLWALSSQTQAGAQPKVTDIGPLPWLYGHWEAVRKAQGKVLIIWSPEAKKTYQRWMQERIIMDKNKKKKEDHRKQEGISRVNVEGFSKLNGWRPGNCEKGKSAAQKICVKSCDDTDWSSQTEPSTVIAPVFMATLACLEGMMLGCKNQEVVFVYLQGLCHSRDIPKAFRSVPRYCLPQDFRGLIQELGAARRQTETDKFSWHCWPRLLSKVLSMWLARQLAQRLQTLLPHTQGKTMPRVRSTQRLVSDKPQNGLKWPLAANTARSGTVQEHKPLHSDPWRAEKR